jgi:putative ABC transport system substrate-binding protein
MLQGLRDFGWVDGQNISIEYRFAEGKPDRLAELAAELVRLKPDVIVVQSNTVAVLPRSQRRQSRSSWLMVTTPSPVALWLA